MALHARLPASVLALATLTLTVVATASAQVADMSKVRCAELAAAHPDDVKLMVFWLLGYNNGAARVTSLDVRKTEANALKLIEFCQKNPTIGAMSLIDQAVIQKAIE
jgi:hypothetical protein